MTLAPALVSIPRPARPWLKQLGLVGVVLAMVLALSVQGHRNRRGPADDNTFLNKRNLVENVATPMSYYAIMAVGVTVVIISGGIDISVGSILCLSAMLGAWAVQRSAVDAANDPAWRVLPIALGVPLLVGVACGVVNGALVVLLRIHPFIVTLGTMGIFRGLATVLPPRVALPTSPLKVPLSFTERFMKLEAFEVRVVPLALMLLVFVAGLVYLRFFVAGANTYAIGGNEEAARLSGLRVGRTKLACYAISGACAGLAGAISLGYYGSATADTARGYELTVVAAAVVGGASLAGGKGTALAALLGALVIGLIENGISILRWNQEYRQVIIGASIIAAVSIDRLGEALGGRRV